MERRNFLKKMGLVPVIGLVGLTKAEEIRTQPKEIRITFACGTWLNINVPKQQQWLKEISAEHKTDMGVQVNGQKKEFTFREFAEKLGFERIQNDTIKRNDEKGVVQGINRKQEER